jgi:hypothetical protein
MREILIIGKALYEVDRRIINYWYYARNPEKVSNEEEEQNKRKIDNFTKIFRDGRRKKFSISGLIKFPCGENQIKF